MPPEVCTLRAWQHLQRWLLTLTTQPSTSKLSDNPDLDAKPQGIYLALFTDPEGDSCFSIYQISWIKVKKISNFCKLKTSLSRNFVYILKTFGEFCQVHFYDFVANSA